MVRGYEMPETLQRLFQIDKMLIEQYGKNFDEFFGACPCFEYEGYECTPEDAIVFLWTGANGDHFAFLTEGDTVVSLEDAPIVFIQPMNFSDQIKPVANNIKEFLALYVRIKEIYIFEWLPSYESEEEFLRDYEESFAEDILENEEKMAIIVSAIEHAIELPKIESVYTYI